MSKTELLVTKNVYLEPKTRVRAVKRKIEDLAQLGDLAGLMPGIDNRRSAKFPRKVEITIIVREA